MNVDSFNEGIEEAAHILDVEALRLHTIAVRNGGELAKSADRDANHITLLASLIREKKK